MAGLLVTALGVSRLVPHSDLWAATGTPVDLAGAARFQTSASPRAPSILDHLRDEAELARLREAPNHDALFLRFIRAGGGLVPWMGFSWKLSRRFLPGDWARGGGTLAFQPDPAGKETVLYKGPQPNAVIEQKWGIFEPPSGWKLLSTVLAMPVIVRNAVANPNLWAVQFRAAYDFIVQDVEGRNCNAVRTSASTDAYADAVVREDRNRRGENCCADFKIVRCGAHYDRIFPALREAAVTCCYSRDGEIIGGKAIRAPHGFMFWGGDGRTDGKGQGESWRNPRKCLRLTVRDYVSEDTQGTFCWGSMGQDISFIDCSGSKCGDVGFDFEGSLNCVARRCRSVDAVNGCFSTFFHCDGILFEDCVAITTDHRRPLFRMYTISQSNSENRSITIRRGMWTNEDRSGIGTIDTRSGCCRDLDIDGLQLSNVRIDTAFHNPHNTRIANNRLSFTFAARSRFSAIRTGFAKSLAGSNGTVVGRTQVIGNSIDSTAEQPANAAGYGSRGDYGSCAIDLIEDDFNSSASSTIRGNRIGKGFLTPILVRNWSANPGMRPRIEVADNVIGIHSSRNHRPIVFTRDGPGIQAPAVSQRGNKRATGEAIAIP